MVTNRRHVEVAQVFEVGTPLVEVEAAEDDGKLSRRGVILLVGFGDLFPGVIFTVNGQSRFASGVHSTAIGVELLACTSTPD